MIFIVLREQPPPIKTVLYKDYAISILKNNHIEALNISDWKIGYEIHVSSSEKKPEIFSKVWFGTGYEEWGGHLLTLDLASGKWSEFYSPLQYVNSITKDNKETIWIAWAMSHFITYYYLYLINTHW